MASGQDSEGYRVWISRSTAGVRKRGRKLSNARCFHGNPLIWLDADTEGHRVTGGVTRQMGEQQEVISWTGRERVPYQSGSECGRSLSVPQHLEHTQTRWHTNKHTLGDTNNS